MSPRAFSHGTVTARRECLCACAASDLSEADSEEADHSHLEQHPPMAEPADVGGAVAPGAVANRHIHKRQPQHRSWKQQLEITKRVKIAEGGAPRGEAGVVMARE